MARRSEAKRRRVSVGLLIRRAFTFAIDLYLGALCGTLPVSFLSAWETGTISQDVFQLSTPVALSASALGLLCMAAYYCLTVLLSARRSTIGMRITGLKVEGTKKSMVIRQLLYTLVFGTGYQYISHIVSILSGMNLTSIFRDIFTYTALASLFFLFFPGQRTLIDLLSKTTIIKEDNDL